MVRDPSRQHELPRRRIVLGRIGLHALLVLLVIALALASPLAAFAQAQPPRSFRIVPTDLPDLEPEEVEDEETVDIASAATKLIVDTDPGVDDAAALIWLFSQTRRPVDVLGIVTVAGNTDVDSATTNAQLVLSWLGETDVPVVRGADKPSVQIASKANQLFHGPDGLWGASAYGEVGSATWGWYRPPSTTNTIDNTAPKFYCDTLAANPGATVLAIGPLTNVAKAIDRCKNRWAGVRMVTLGGAKFGGNQTPVSEYNYWQDPEAADFVFDHSLAYGYTLEQVPEDAFDQFVLRGDDMTLLYGSANEAMANLLFPLTFYMCQLSQQCAYDPSSGFPVVDGNGVPILWDVNGDPILPEDARFPALPDPVAAIYTVFPELGIPQPLPTALVKILAGEAMPEYVRGQSIIGLSFEERLSMIVDDAELNALIDLAFVNPDEFFNQLFIIVSRDPDNATVVTDVAARRMINRFLRYVANGDGESAGASVSIDTVEGNPPTGENKLLLPMLSGD